MASNVPSTQRALKCFGPKNAKVVNDAPVPEAPSDYLLVKVDAVALNPTDWKHIDFIAKPDYNHTVGCDYAGTAVSVGSDVKKSFKPGDRVSGFAHGSKHEDPSSGCFAEYAKVKGDIQARIPDHISFEEAASWPTGINTAGQGMYGPDGLGLPWPDQPAKERFPVLVYGASTNTGLWAIQYAKLSGLRVLATCSEKNFEAVKALGADEVYDYKDKMCGEKINEASKDSLKFAFDCVSEGSSMEICAKALSSDGYDTRYNALLPVEFPRKDVKTSFTIGYSVNGEEFTFFGNHVPAKPEDFEFGKKWWTLAEKLLAEGKIKAPATNVRDGGLQGILEGFEDMKNGRISRQKLVYRIADTA
ncbi:Putative GroES-like superfamily, alcohol dehydrogenase-like, NAD(P)-binding domain superfamily [Septoria linicola]|uniref:GroES-like superfamily, alcohol dehydrogenase-like, NAD(P)-binding domain superfamily n=1 Tax=Septoria linicola TaxID=215465 RepID=A0A9Q9AXE1_9PEZI|nr:Putative GroES-like superfamily, alcohol dehydrogenase-like, NAD(P)-binding domain superfamily [Septoria linicola]